VGHEAAQVVAGQHVEQLSLRQSLDGSLLWIHKGVKLLQRLFVKSRSALRIALLQRDIIEESAYHHCKFSEKRADFICDYGKLAYLCRPFRKRRCAIDYDYRSHQRR